MIGSHPVHRLLLSATVSVVGLEDLGHLHVASEVLQPRTIGRLLDAKF
jgi:hypothetical protein